MWLICIKPVCLCFVSIVTVWVCSIALILLANWNPIAHLAITKVPDSALAPPCFLASLNLIGSGTSHWFKSA